MEPFQFQVKPRQAVELSFDFSNAKEADQICIDILRTGKYVNTIDGRIQGRIEFRNFQTKNVIFHTGVNDSDGIWNFDLRGEQKFSGATGEDLFHDMPEYRKTVISERVTIIQIGGITRTPGSIVQHSNVVAIKVELQ